MVAMAKSQLAPGCQESRSHEQTVAEQGSVKNPGFDHDFQRSQRAVSKILTYIDGKNDQSRKQVGHCSTRQVGQVSRKPQDDESHAKALAGFQAVILPY